MNTILIISGVYYGVLLLATFVMLGICTYKYNRTLKLMKKLNQLDLTLEQAIAILDFMDKFTEEQFEEQMEELTEEERLIIQKTLEKALEIVKDESK